MQQSQRESGVAVALVPDPASHASEHERCSLLGFASRLAALQSMQDGGLYDPIAHRGARLYFVPSNTLSARDARPLGIRCMSDLYGGVVPHPFVATKAIGHPLVAAGARAAQGWSDDFPQRVHGLVLCGYTAFELVDACVAGQRLLARGPVRVKPVRATAGLGQEVVRTPAELRAVLEVMDESEVLSHGLVLEENLGELRTFSIGQVQVAGLVASYWGLQRRTLNNRGMEVFGGSSLTVARGGFDALLALQPPPEPAQAIRQAASFHEAVQACYPGFDASRANYDVILGHDAQGRLRSAVLEQSWRVGGATGPEIAALEAFRADPHRSCVRTACFEIFGQSPPPPPGATVYYRGVDPRSGPITKFTIVEPAPA